MTPVHDLDFASGDDDPEPSEGPPGSAAVPTAFLTPLLLLLPSGALSSPPPATPAPGPATSDTAAAEADGEAETAQDQQEDFLHVGGALRFNLLSTFYEGDRTPNSTQFTWDTWWVNIQASTDGVGLQFEYRFYPTFNTHFIKEGWLEYAFDEETEVQVGVTQSPFGNLQYNSHNWWFQPTWCHTRTNPTRRSTNSARASPVSWSTTEGPRRSWGGRCRWAASTTRLWTSGTRAGPGRLTRIIPPGPGT